MANIFEFLSKDGNITPEKARKSRQMQFHDKTAYVWGLWGLGIDEILRYRWTQFVSSRTLCHPDFDIFSQTLNLHYTIMNFNDFLLFQWIKSRQGITLKPNQRLEVDPYSFYLKKVRSWWRRQNSNKSHKVTSPVCELIYCLKQQPCVLVNNKM